MTALLESQIDLSEASAHAAGALAILGLRPRRSVRSAIGRWHQRLLRALRNRMPEPLVPIVGPDGVGKTTLIESITARTGLHAFTFKNAFRYSLAYRTLHRILGDRSGMQRNLLDEKLVHPLLLIARARWPIAAHLRRVRAGAKRPVLVDRYYWDYLLTLRDARKKPARISGYALQAWLAPTPILAVVLIARTSTILGRKQELTPEAIDTLYTVYCDQLARSGTHRALIQSTDVPLEQAVAAVADFLGHGIDGAARR